MNRISFNILPSLDTNDHETRVLVDNEDLLGDDYVGVDPPSFFSQEPFDKSGILLIGRCTCGVEGCCDYTINASVNDDNIAWTNENGLQLIFNRYDYISAFENCKRDYSWEDIKRKVERLSTEVLKNTQTIDNYNFNWASARINENQITLSYSKNGDQKLFYLAWDGQSDNDVVENAIGFLKENTSKR
jgi:hypothetical protein